MKRIWLMLLAMAFFMAAPVIAQDGDAGSGDNGAAEESAPGMPGDNQGDDAVEDPEVVGQDEGEDVGAAEDADGDEAAEGQVAGGGAAGAQPWTFTSFDQDADGFLTEQEFGTGMFEFVSDDPAGIAQDRYEGALETFNLQGTTDFGAVDADADGFINEQEFSSAFAGNLFQQWDADTDSMLSAQEFSQNMLGAFDTNADAVIDDQEFQTHADWFETDGQQVAGGGAAEGGFGEEFFLGDEVGPGVDATEEQDIGEPGSEEDAGDAGMEDDEGAGDDADGAAGGEAAGDEAAGDDAQDDPQ